MKKLIFIIALFLLILFFKAVALDIELDSCSRKAVETAISQVEAAEGGTVYLPEEDCNWNESEGGGKITNIKGNVDIMGAGVGKTILRVTDGSNFFYFNAGENDSSEDWRVSGITFYSDLDCVDECHSSTAIQWRKTENYRIDHNHFEGYFGTMFEFKSCSKGLIDNNTFINHNVDTKNYYGISAGQPYGGKPSNDYICNINVCTCEAGDESEDRSTYVSSGNTVISSTAAVINNSGGAGKGKVKRIYIYIDSIGSDPYINVASFFRTGNVFTARARTTALSVAQGLNIITADEEDFTEFDIHNGDYIGVYLNNASIDVDSGGRGWTTSGDQTNGDNVDFGSPDVEGVSIWVELFDDEGHYAACETAWDDWWDDKTRGGGYYDGFNKDWFYADSQGNQDNAHYIEDNKFTWYKSTIVGNWGAGAAFVIRHNTFENSTGAVFTGMKPGQITAIIHDNEFKFAEGVYPIPPDLAGASSPPTTPTGYAFRMRVDGLIYNNRLVDLSYAGKWTAHRNYSDYYYTLQTRPKELYIWNNEYVYSTDDHACGTTDIDCWSLEEGTSGTRHYWISGKGDNGSIHFRGPQPGERLYGFTELIHPHPDADCTDEDSDGYCEEYNDCDDSNPLINPGEEEDCDDGIDNNCDGRIDSDDLECSCWDIDEDGYYDELCGGSDCDDLDAYTHPSATEVCGDGIDQDCDGEDLDCEVEVDDEDEDGYTISEGDCDDEDPLINPGADEICDNEVDDDCDGYEDLDDPECEMGGIIVDNGDLGTSSTGEWEESQGSHPYGEGSVFTRTVAYTYSFEAEINGLYDVSLWWTYSDARCTTIPVEIYDGTELVDTVFVNQLEDASQWNMIGTFSFDNKAKIKIISQGYEVDDTCSTNADAVKFVMIGSAECQDSDGDGYEDESCGGDDCNDADAAINPGAEEICDDELDNDCDGLIDFKDEEDCFLPECPDGDQDGYLDEACGGHDCDDRDEFVFPDAEEICDDGIDQDCDGKDLECEEVDVDGDGFLISDGDCDDSDKSINPSAEEICDDEIDNDCDGYVDANDASCNNLEIDIENSETIAQARNPVMLSNGCGVIEKENNKGMFSLVLFLLLCFVLRKRFSQGKL